MSENQPSKTAEAGNGLSGLFTVGLVCAGVWYLFGSPSENSNSTASTAGTRSFEASYATVVHNPSGRSGIVSVGTLEECLDYRNSLTSLKRQGYMDGAQVECVRE
mgnify:CR=1 FL=1